MSEKKIQRKEKILKYVGTRNHVTVTELCRSFGASEATIRRDLEELASDHLIKRTHGGAKAIIGGVNHTEVSLADDEFEDEIRAISVAAAQLVMDNETIFLGSGRTIFAMVPHLKERQGLTIVSNALNVVNEFLGCTQVSLVVIGGIMRSQDRSMIGHIAERSVKELRADKVFVGTEALDFKAGLTNSYLPKTRTDRAIISISANVVLVTDHSKFYKTKTAFWAPLSIVSTIVTDWHLTLEEKEKFAQLGIDVIQGQPE